MIINKSIPTYLEKGLLNKLILERTLVLPAGTVIIKKESSWFFHITVIFLKFVFLHLFNSVFFVYFLVT